MNFLPTERMVAEPISPSTRCDMIDTIFANDKEKSQIVLEKAVKFLKLKRNLDHDLDFAINVRPMIKPLN